MEKDLAIRAYGEYYSSRLVEADRKKAKVLMEDGSYSQPPEFDRSKNLLERYDNLLEVIEPLLDGDHTPAVTIAGEHNGEPVEVSLGLSVVRTENVNFIRAHWAGQPPRSYSSSKALHHVETIEREVLARVSSPQQVDKVSDSLDELEWSAHEYLQAVDTPEPVQA